MTIALEICVVAFLSVMAYWGKTNPLPFMLCAPASFFLGLHCYDVITTSFGLTVSMMLIVYGLACFGFAYRCIFWRGSGADE